MNRATAYFAILVFAASPALSDEPGEQKTKVSGIDQSLFSQDVGPGENFYLFANQNWLGKTEIPADKSNYGIFTMLSDQTQEKVRGLIESAASGANERGSAAQKVGDLYASVMNTAALGTLRRSGVYGPIVPYVSVDARDSDNYAVYLTQSGLTMPDRDYYLEDEPRYVELRRQLKTYIADMLRLLGEQDPQQAAESVFAIETRIAEAHWTKTENRDPEKK